MSDFERLVRETGFLLRGDVGHGEQDMVLTVSALGLTGTQVASLKDVEAAGFVPADRLNQVESALARTRAKLKDLDVNHTALKRDHERKLAALQHEHTAQVEALESALSAQIAAARDAMAARQDTSGREKEALEDALDDERARRHAEREAAADALLLARAAFEDERGRLSAEIRVWEARQRAEREGIQARNDGAALDSNPYGAADQAANQAWRSGWILRDGLLRLNEHAHRLQAERDGLVHAMERARPEVERLLAENQTLKTTAEALRSELVRVNAEHHDTQQALETCLAQLQARRDES